mmetsp:Transcript_25228/g.81595  ORF Transcript_25228/g.81595 Transcript_25228/m.81595 type:complete len:510 (+) Transcript_25228:75-1604(+)
MVFSMMMVLAMVALVVALVGGLVVVMTRKGKGKEKKVPKVLGSMSETLAKMNCAETPWFLLDLAKQLAPGERVYRLALPFFVPRTFVLADPMVAQAVLRSKSVDKPAVYSEFAALTMRQTLFTRPSTDPMQPLSRKGTAPAFSARRVNSSVRSSDFKSVLKDVFDVLDLGHPFDPAELLTMATIDIIGKVALGGIDFGTVRSLLVQDKDASSDEKEANLGATFLKELPVALREYSMRRMFNPLRKYYARFTDAGARAEEAKVKLWAVAEQIMRASKASTETSSTGEGCAILDHLRANRNFESDADRIAEIQMYLIAGHDTTGYSLAWTAYEVAKRGPTFAAMLRDEIKAGVHLTKQDSLFERTCKEAMRLWPVAAMGPFREIVDPDGLHVKTDACEFDLPYKSTCVIPMLPILRSAPGIKDPDTFDPDRWLDPDQAQPLKDSFFPFSLGSRNCLGMALAQAEHRHLFAAIIERYDLSLVKDFTPDFFLTLKPNGGLLKATKVLADSPAF